MRDVSVTADCADIDPSLVPSLEREREREREKRQRRRAEELRLWGV